MAHLQQNQQTLKPSQILDRLNQVVRDVEHTLDQTLPQPISRLHEAMRYAVLGKGKRLRSYVLFESASLFNVPLKTIYRAATAIEFIQGYSLVHDDLPPMDNADLRRGKPSCHKAFDEATAILVGDALIPLGYQTLSSLETSSDIKLTLIHELSKVIGSQGLVDGQMRDLGLEGDLKGYEEILEMERLKTGVFFGFAAEAGAILGNASAQERIALKSYGLMLGEAFQMRDDLLDGIGVAETLGKPTGQDQEKLTFFHLLGEEDLTKEIETTSLKAIDTLHPFGERAKYLNDLALHALNRTR